MGKKCIIALTDNDWYENLLNDNNEIVNFWTPTPWNVQCISKGERVYFLLKAPIRKICGFGEFVDYKNMAPLKAWLSFGLGNGVNSEKQLFLKTHTYKVKNSARIGLHEIGCIILSNVTFFDKENFINLADYNLELKNGIVKYKCLEDIISLNTAVEHTVITPFALVNDEIIYKSQQQKDRPGRSMFKTRLLKSYKNVCCVTGEQTVETLQAAHIQEYINSKSDHVQNGLLLRSDIHNLFDNGLMTIDKEFKIKISTYLNSEYYKHFDGYKIKLPDDKNDYPSLEAIEYHNLHVFKKLI